MEGRGRRLGAPGLPAALPTARNMQPTRSLLLAPSQGALPTLPALPILPAGAAGGARGGESHPGPTRGPPDAAVARLPPHRPPPPPPRSDTATHLPSRRPATTLTQPARRYDGPSLLGAIDALRPPQRGPPRPLRLPVSEILLGGAPRFPGRPLCVLPGHPSRTRLTDSLRPLAAGSRALGAVACGGKVAAGALRPGQQARAALLLPLIITPFPSPISPRRPPSRRSSFYPTERANRRCWSCLRASLPPSRRAALPHTTPPHHTPRRASRPARSARRRAPYLPSFS